MTILMYILVALFSWMLTKCAHEKNVAWVIAYIFYILLCIFALAIPK